MKYTVWGLLLLLLIARNDFWFWNDDSLLFGFLPIGLFYHMGISIGAAALWFLATIYCWPDGLEEIPPEDEEEESNQPNDSSRHQPNDSSSRGEAT